MRRLLSIFALFSISASAAYGSKLVDLLGGSQGWKKNWMAVDDRVRGGKSQSYLEILSDGTARFYGELDTKTLGGAGFASQRLNHPWDLSRYAGLQIHVKRGDGKTYSLNFFATKDPVSSNRLWKVSFETEKNRSEVVTMYWKDFEEHYRGRPVQNPSALPTHDLQGLSIMCQSFFDKQQGEFDLNIDKVTLF